MTPEATLSHAAARALYDWIGRWQDTQRFYEDLATSDLVAHAALEQANSVFEFGAGTGRLAERMLRDHLPPGTLYRGVDVSTTMVALAEKRLQPWLHRAAVTRSDGSTKLEAPSARFDRFVSTYVLDLLSSEDIVQIVCEARRLLVPEGLLCLVCAAPGTTLPERIVMGAAAYLYALSPRLVGGCRAIELGRFVGSDHWRVVHRRVVSKWGIPSEVLVAARRA